MRLPDINDLIQDLQLAKQIAIDDRKPTAIVTATMSQAKLLGMDNMRDITPHNGQPVVFNIAGVSPEPLTPEVALAISKRLDEEY